MHNNTALKLLFIINRNSGNKTVNFYEAIQKYLSSSPHLLHFYDLPEDCSKEKTKQKIKETQPNIVIAVGGDGTVKHIAECILQTNTPLGILPAGSANGMAKELGIPSSINDALNTILNPQLKTIHAVKVNDEVCIHLSDIGFNAFVVKKFETQQKRGMWSYIKATVKVLQGHPVMEVNIQSDNVYIQRKAAMIVIANATKYGSGLLINPKGSLEDDLFEVVIVKKISFREVFKMKFTHSPFNPAKTELLQTRSLQIHSRHKAHFQVDGEYLGKIHTITATILPAALTLIVPRDDL